MSLAKIERVVISGGGTGGHVFPAIAIANGLKAALQDVEILFVGAKGKIEMEKVPAAGYKIIGLNIAGFQRSLSLKNLAFPFKLIVSLIKSFFIIRKFKPDVAIGVGGYASGPLLYMANKSKVPTLIQEQNSYPGITNKLLAKKAKTICVAYDGLERFFAEEKIVKTGNPVRKEIAQVQYSKTDAKKHFGFDSEKPLVLAIGGSLGARTINESLQNAMSKIIEADVQLLWQCGKLYYSVLKNQIPDHSNIRLTEFIGEMEWAYASADIIVSRAGALSISELCLIGKPVILIPSPNVSEDHQTHNARSLSDKNAAVLLADKDAKEQLGNQIISLLNDNKLQAELSDNIRKMSAADATDRIVHEILKLRKSA